MNAKTILGGVIILVFVVWGATAFMDTTIQYVSLDAAASSPRPVQVMGKIDFDAVQYDSDSELLRFAIYDAQAEQVQGAKRLDVVYRGIVPGNFDQATSVVLKGQPDASGTFVAEQMLVKCPSKYQGEGGEYQDMEKHNQAVEGGDI